MARPLNLDWNVLLPDESNNSTQVDEIEVIKTPNGNGLPSHLDKSKLSEGIKRIRSTLGSDVTKKLPDKGEKLKHKLKEMEEEFDRWENDKTSKKDTNMSCQSNPTDSSGPYHGSNPRTTNKPSSFVSIFREKLDKRENGVRKSWNNSQPKRKNGEQLNQNKTKNNYGPLPLESQTHCNDKFSNHSARELSSARKSIGWDLFKRISFSGMSLSRSGKNSSEDSCAFDQRSKKVKDVVLLDDEEAEADVLLPEDALTVRKSFKLYYPSRDDPEAIEITASDIQCLKPGTYLTSPVMNFYIRYLQRQFSPTSGNGDYHFFNTYFYKKLLDDVSFKGDEDEQFLKLRRWWKGINIFQMAYIFLPIHGDMHWSLVIICMPNKEDALGPVMLHLDSLGIHSSGKIFDVIKRFLIEEWCYLNRNDPPFCLPFSDKIWKNLPSEIKQQNLTVPQQKNDYDCGLFVLYFMEKFIKEVPRRFRKKYISKFDRATGRNWFKPEEASGLRKRIKQVIDEQCHYAESDNDEMLESPTHSGGSSHSEPHELIDIF